MDTVCTRVELNPNICTPALDIPLFKNGLVITCQWWSIKIKKNPIESYQCKLSNEVDFLLFKNKDKVDAVFVRNITQSFDSYRDRVHGSCLIKFGSLEEN